MSRDKSSTTRSEEVRQRRTWQSRRPKVSGVSRRGRKIGAAQPPPTLIRGGQMGAPRQEARGAKRARRRYDIALNADGAEMRLPSLPAIRFGWRLVSGMLVGVLIVALYLLWNSPIYRVDAVKVEGLRRLTVDEINARLGVTGRSIFTLDAGELQQQLLHDLPVLSQVKVQISIPASVRLRVTERLPVLTWQQDGRVLWVDAGGVSFSPLDEAGPSVVVEAHSSPPTPPLSVESAPGEAVRPSAGDGHPVVRADSYPHSSSQRFLSPEMVTAILVLSTSSPPGTPLVYTLEHGLGWRDSRGWEVYFGLGVEDMAMKLRVYEAIVEHLVENHIQPVFVSVEYVHAPYYRLER